ncbi:MAG: hypothetical protein RIC06_21560 [Cyclobacteriaceae bacterium]
MKACILTILIALSIPTYSQVFGFDYAEAYYGYGYTAIDLEEWVGSTLWNWDQANYGGHVQVFFLRAGPVAAGIQLGYQTLFWYETRSDAGFATPIYRQYWPGATQIMIVGQTGGEKGWFSEFGIGGYSGESISGLAITGGGGYRIGLNRGFGIPLKIKIDALFAEQPMLVSTFFAGLSYRFNKPSD